MIATEDATLCQHGPVEATSRACGPAIVPRDVKREVRNRPRTSDERLAPIPIHWSRRSHGDARAARRSGGPDPMMTPSRGARHAYATRGRAGWLEAPSRGVVMPDEKIVFERVRILIRMKEAVDIGLRRESRARSADGADTLVGSKHMWPRDVPDRCAGQFSQLRSANLRVRPSPRRERWCARSRGRATRTTSRRCSIDAYPTCSATSERRE